MLDSLQEKMDNFRNDDLLEHGYTVEQRKIINQDLEEIKRAAAIILQDSESGRPKAHVIQPMSHNDLDMSINTLRTRVKATLT